jgi:NTE family protein
VFVLLALALALLPLSPASAQPQPRIRVGLALGGGSARALAHIGVLQWFEEHRVPVDVVAGTSMGGLIGGAFASGMSPAEIRVRLATLDWSTVLAADTPFAEKSFRRKEDARAFPSRLQVGLKHGFMLPSGLSTGAQVDLLLNRIAAPYPTDLDFDNLPTPFRCVATDLRTATIVVFRSGWLSRALRSTMAVPGLFPPVQVGRQVLVDGGVLNNLPADVVKETGLADIVIAVDVGADLTYQQRSDSITAVVGEASDVMIRSATRRALESADVVLAPDLMGFTASEFGRAEELVRRGYAIADASAAALERFALSESDYADWSATRRARRQSAMPRPSIIRVEGITAMQSAEVGRRLARHVNRVLDPDALDRDLTALTGAGRYESATYRFEVENGAIALVVTIRPVMHGPPFLSMSLDLQSTQGSDVATTIRSRVLLFDPLGAGSEVRIDMSLGRTLLAAGEIYRPIGRTGLFVSPSGGALRRHLPVFGDGKYVAEYSTRSMGLDIDVGYSTERRAEVRIGSGIENIDSRTRIGESGLPTVTGTQQHVAASVVYDGQTGPTIPERGIYVKASLRRYFAPPAVAMEDGTPWPEPHGLWSGEADASWFHPVGGRGRIFVRAAGGTSFGQITLVHPFTLGGPFHLGAFYADELRGSNFVLGNVGYFREVMRLAEGAMGRLSFGIWLEHGAVFDRRQEAKFHANASGAFVVESPIGPVFLGGSISTDRGDWPSPDNRQHPAQPRLYVGVGPIPLR